MQIKLSIKSLLLSFIIISSLEAKESISLTQTKSLITKQKVYIIGINEKTQWFKNSAKVKNYQSINRAILEYKHPKIDFTHYKRDTTFIISSKHDLLSIKFVEKLKNLGFINVRYLISGESNYKEILVGFRGIKLFSMFRK